MIPNYKYVLMEVYPVSMDGLNESKETGIKHAMLEVAMTAYLMGMGYDYEYAHDAVEAWEYDDRFGMYY